MFETIVIAVSLIGAVVSIPAGVYYLWDRNRVNIPKKIGWGRIEEGARKTIKRLRSDNWVPDLVLAIGRSGAIYGGLIAGNMGNLPMAILDRHLVWDNTKREFVADHHSMLQLPEDYRRILVVVGEVYSGQSLTASMEQLTTACAGKSIRTACLVISKNATTNVDYFVYQVERSVRPAWILNDDYKRFDLLPKKETTVPSA